MKKFIAGLVGFLLMSCCTFAQKATLQLNLVKGNTYYNITQSAATINQTIQGQAMQMQVNIAGKLSFTVTGIRDSLYDMQVKYDSLNLNMQLPNGNLASSSESGANDIFSAILARLKAKPFTVVMSKTGKVHSVTGLETIFNGILDGFDQIPADQRAQATNQVMQSFGEKSFKGSIELFSYIYPTVKVSKNDKWVIDSRIESNISAGVHTVYTLKDITPTHYVIDGLSAITTNSASQAAQLNGMPVKYNLAGNMSTTLKADKKTGWISEALIKQTIKGNTQITDNPKLPGGMLIPMQIATTTTVSDK